MKKIYLNSDKSLYCELENDLCILSSNHANKKNSYRLCNNIKKILSITKGKDGETILLNNVPFVTVNEKGVVYSKNLLTSFETKLFSQGENEKITNLPFARFDKKAPKLQTDLHTHFAGALTPNDLIKCAYGHNIRYQTDILKKIGIDYSYMNVQSGRFGDTVALEEIISNEDNKQKLINAMKIDSSEQETFNKMEEIYTARGPITKNPEMFIPLIKAIAEDCQKQNVKYIELSLSSLISDTNQLRLLNEKMPEIEKQTGVQVRFLGAMWRHSDKEWNADETDRLKVTSQSPYVVGCDVMGHETNSTMEFYDNIKDLAKHAMLNDPNFVIRVHAGENPLFKANARQVLLAVEEAHYELEQENHKKYKYPQVRLGHGIYGFDEPAPWDEKERTRDISMLQLCKEINPIVEFNMSSNLSLNNINGLQEIPIKKYLDNGIRVVLGTDGRGIYSTDLNQEIILAHEAGLELSDFEKIQATERDVIKNAEQRFKKYKKCDLDIIEEKLKNCFANGQPQYNSEVEQKYRQEAEQVQTNLNNYIKNCGAETDLQKINDAIKDKTPIMLTGSSNNHWPKVSEESRKEMRVALNVLVQCLNPEKAYFETGGTNHGVEKELHQIANEYNNKHDKKFVVLGTLTEEAVHTDTNSIEPNTITHAVIPTMFGKPAKRWFDLPDCTLMDLQEKNGVMIAMGGGSVVSDMIQRSHNMGLNMAIMDGVEGASTDKAKLLSGNNYEFSNAKDLIVKIYKENKNLFVEGLTNDYVDNLINESYKIFTPQQNKIQINNKESGQER